MYNMRDKLLDLCAEVSEESHDPYRMIFFIENYGPVRALQIVIENGPTESFRKLKKIKRLDLTAEAFVCGNREYHKSLGDKVVKMANERLKRHGYVTSVDSTSAVY